MGKSGTESAAAQRQHNGSKPDVRRRPQFMLHICTVNIASLMRRPPLLPIGCTASTDARMLGPKILELQQGR